MKGKPPGQPRWAYVDVDGTLLVRHEVNQALVTKLKAMKADGWIICVWSSRGSVYAQAAVIKAGLEEVTDHVLSKPGWICDDQGLGWLEYVRVSTG